MDNKFLLSIRIVFLGVFIAPVIFLCVVLAMQKDIARPLTRADDPFLYIVIIVATMAVISSNMLYRLRLPAVKTLTSNSEKLAGWRTLFIVRLAMIEGATLFAIVALLLQECQIYLYIAAALIGVQTLNFPKASSIQNEIELN